MCCDCVFHQCRIIKLMANGNSIEWFTAISLSSFQQKQSKRKMDSIPEKNMHKKKNFESSFNGQFSFNKTKYCIHLLIEIDKKITLNYSLPFDVIMLIGFRWAKHLKFLYLYRFFSFSAAFDLCFSLICFKRLSTSQSKSAVVHRHRRCRSRCIFFSSFYFQRKW